MISWVLLQKFRVPGTTNRLSLAWIIKADLLNSFAFSICLLEIKQRKAHIIGTFVKLVNQNLKLQDLRRSAFKYTGTHITLISKEYRTAPWPVVVVRSPFKGLKSHTMTLIWKYLPLASLCLPFAFREYFVSWRIRRLDTTSTQISPEEEEGRPIILLHHRADS